MDVKYLPSANEVWEKVMFLHLCVILFTGGVSVPACITGHMTGVSLSWGGCLCPGGSLSRGVLLQGVSVGRVIVQYGLCLGGSLSGIPPRKRPMYSNDWAVRILLNAFLFHDYFGVTHPFKYSTEKRREIGAHPFVV